MAAKTKSKPSYNPLYDGVDAEAEQRAMAGKNGKKRRLIPCTTVVKVGQKCHADELTAENPPTDPADYLPPAGEKLSFGGILDDPADPYRGQTVADVTPPSRRYALAGEAAADVEQMYVARDLRSVVFTGPAALTGDTLEYRWSMDEPHQTVTRLTADIYADIADQCRRIYDASRGRWSQPATSKLRLADGTLREVTEGERVTAMLDRFVVLREFARLKGWDA